MSRSSEKTNKQQTTTHTVMDDVHVAWASHLGGGGGCPDVLCSVHSTEQLKDVKVCDSQFHSFVQAH